MSASGFTPPYGPLPLSAGCGAEKHPTGVLTNYNLSAGVVGATIIGSNHVGLG